MESRPSVTLPSSVQYPRERKKLVTPAYLLAHNVADHQGWYVGDPEGTQVIPRKVHLGDQGGWERKLVSVQEATRTPSDATT